MLWIFFALAEMPLVIEMVAAYSHPRRTSYTFWMVMMVWMTMVTMVMNVFVHVDTHFITL